jgi:hypothetical protein
MTLNVKPVTTVTQWHFLLLLYWPLLRLQDSRSVAVRLSMATHLLEPWTMVNGVQILFVWNVYRGANTTCKLSGCRWTNEFYIDAIILRFYWIETSCKKSKVSIFSSNDDFLLCSDALIDIPAEFWLSLLILLLTTFLLQILQQQWISSFLKCFVSDSTFDVQNSFDFRS